MPHPVRTALFVLSLALFLATATPVAWGHEGHSHDGPRASRAQLAGMVESSPRVTPRRVDAYMIEELHERHGHRVWARGRGDWGHTWSVYRVQARQLRTYLRSQHEVLRRFALIWHWAPVARCESTGDWAIDTGNGYYGGLQFSLATWQDLGGTGYPHQAAKATQIQMGKRLHDRSGWNAWPGCARKLGWT